MRKESTGSRSESRPEWEQLEDWVRSQVQRLIQELLEEEVTAFPGRAKSALRSDSDSDTGYRNGYGRARRLTLSSGTIQLRRPRVRDTEEQFESRLLPLFVNRTRKVAELIPELYLHGLSEGDFDPALRGLLGEDASVSASTVARLKSKWNDELAQWRSQPLDDLEVVYMWVDGVYVKASLEKEKAAVLVVMAALSDGSKVVVSTVPGYRESTESWSEVLRDIKRRGLSCPRLVVGDGHLGIWGALRNVYPQAAEQRCWNHKIVNVLAKLPKRQQDQAKLMLRTIPYAQTRTEAERLRTEFTRWCRDHSYEAASVTLERDWDRMITFYDFPKEHWSHLRTTNPVESPFAALRLRTDAAKRYKRVDRAIAVIWKMLMVAEQRFRRLKAPELIEDVGLEPAEGREVDEVEAGLHQPGVADHHVDALFHPVRHPRLPPFGGHRVGLHHRTRNPWRVRMSYHRKAVYPSIKGLPPCQWRKVSKMDRGDLGGSVQRNRDAPGAWVDRAPDAGLPSICVVIRYVTHPGYGIGTG